MKPKTPPTLDLKRGPRGYFLPGNPPGPGKPKGSRNQLGERFLRDLHAFWREEGQEVIKRAARQQPASFVCSLVILLRPTTRDLVDDETSEFDHLETVDEVLDVAREKLGQTAADALSKMFIEPPKPVRAESKRARKATRSRARFDNRE